MRLSDRLKYERKNKGLNQPELAKVMNVTKQTVSNWENGNRVPDANTLKDIADFFDCSVDYLLCRTNERNGLINKYNIDGIDVIMEVSKDIYPNGLTKEEVVQKLKIIKQMEELGFKFPEVEQD